MVAINMEQRIKYVAPSILLIAIASGHWLSKVSYTVSKAYLDEVFHVGQAQTYCDGKFMQWDPKITTPPGVYILSYIIFRITGRCDITALRALNCLAICGIMLVAGGILPKIRYIARRQTHPDREDAKSDAHTAFNVAFFPPLFFFSSLYYTDVTSTLCVLLAHYFFLDSVAERSFRTKSTIFAILVGILALGFRQTNVFWVAVFPGGLAVLHALKSIKGGRDSSTSSINQGFIDVIQQSWQQSRIFDYSVGEAYFQDYVKVSLSIALVAIRNLGCVMIAVGPYASILVIFAAFVAWNGGVVLGDKSNHVATIHVPQMLYIWPYILFFSFPLAVPRAALSLLHLWTELKAGNISFRTTILSTLSWFSIMSSVSLVAVHYNTIIHPFTLADNRHYVFYIFRILMRHPLIKYLAVPIYCASAWFVTQALSEQADSALVTQRKKDKVKPAGSESDIAKDHQTPVSFVLIWTFTVTLSVITAPLVEPRYFILPWIMWRIYLPRQNSSMQHNMRQKYTSYQPTTPRLLPVSVAYLLSSLQLWAETVWFLIVNCGTAYMFLSRGFFWPQEPGQIQRFLW